jgi:DNA-binding CsgD family transcriptional regulator
MPTSQMSGGREEYDRRVAPSVRRSRLAEAVDGLGDDRPDDRVLRRRALDTIATLVPFEHFVFVLTDPETTVGVSPLAEVPEGAALPGLIRLRYLSRPARWTALPEPACTTLRALDDRPGSGGWSAALAEHGVRDVLLAVLRDRHGTWAFLDLWRHDGVFRDDEVAAVAEALPVLTSQLRAAVGRTFVAPSSGTSTPRQHPGVLLLDDDLAPVAGTPALQDWLATLLPPAADASPVPASAFNAGAQLLAVEAGVDAHPPSARVAVASGTWLTVSAERLTYQAQGASIAVTYAVASAADRLEVFVRACGLSARERDVVRAVATGGDTRALARTLGISDLTVQDHLKAVFARTGAATRAELLARALGH